jgi:hypothetical protein
LFPFLAEIIQFPGKYPDVWGKEYYQKGKELYSEKDFVETFLYESRKVDNNTQHEKIEKVADLQKER